MERMFDHEGDPNRNNGQPDDPSDDPSGPSGLPGGLSDLAGGLAGMLGLLKTAASMSFKSCDEQIACDTVLTLEEIRRFLDATECHAIAELEARSVTDRDFGLRTSPWLASRAGLPPGVAKSRVKTARTLDRLLPDVDQALTTGAISFEHARVFANATNPRNAEGMAAVSAELCGEAPQMTFNKMAVPGPTSSRAAR